MGEGITIAPGLASMLMNMYEAWEDNDRPFFPTDRDYVELKAFCNMEPQPYRLADGGLQMAFNISFSNGGNND